MSRRIVITSWLKRHRRRRAWRLLAGMAGAGTAAYCLLAWLCSWLEAIGLLPRLGEKGTIWLLGSLMAATALAVAAAAWRRLMDTWPLRAMADAHARAVPADAQQLESAIELENENGPLRPFPEALLREYQRRLARGHFAILRNSPAFAASWRHLPLALSGIIAALIMIFLPSPLQRRARLTLSSGDAGISLTWATAATSGAPQPFPHQNRGNARANAMEPQDIPWDWDAPPAEVPAGSALEVRARFSRYQGESRDAVLECNGLAIPMQTQPPAMACIRLYEVEEPLRFRVVSRTLSSAWHRIGVYAPPAPLRIEVTCTPPQYTGLPPRHFTQFEDVALPEGSIIAVHCAMDEGKSFRLMELTDDGIATPSDNPRRLGRTATLMAQFYDREGHLAKGTPFKATAIPDLPPELAVASPLPDATLPPGQPLPLAVTAIDDHGLDTVRLHLLLNDQEEMSYTLFSRSRNGGGKIADSCNATPMMELRQELTLPNLEPGSIITGYFSAIDNSSPRPRKSRSQLFFVTIADDALPPGPEDAATLPSADDATAASIGDLISESKRLLRDTAGMVWHPIAPPGNSRGILSQFGENATARNDDDGNHLRQAVRGGRDDAVDFRDRTQGHGEQVFLRRRQALERDLRMLQQSLRGRAVAIAHNAGLKELPPELHRFFENAGEALSQAARLVGAEELRLSIAFQQRALRQLCALNNLLHENAARLRQSGGGGSPSPQNGAPAQSPSNDNPMAADGNRIHDLEMLAEAREELRNMVGHEKQLIDVMQRNTHDLAACADQQQRLAGQSLRLAERLGALAATATPRQHLHGAAEALEDSALACRQDSANPLPGASRAIKQLRDSLHGIEALLEDERRRQAGYLENALRRLAEQQRELMEKSRHAAENGRAAIGDAQKDLNRRSRQLQSQIESLSQMVEETCPDSAAAMRQALSGESARNLARQQKRAENALLYRRYEAAASSQEAIAAQIDDWAQRFNAARIALAEETAEKNNDAEGGLANHHMNAPPPAKYRIPVREYFRKLME